MSIDSNAQQITYQDVETRIEELESRTDSWNVVRVSNGEVLKAGFPDEEDAEEYIDAEDYNPDRIKAEQVELDGDDASELEDLRNLNEEAGNNFDEWDKGSTTLYRFSFFDSTWARGEAAEQYRISNADTYEWPFEQVDWTQAAEDRRDSKYTEVSFSGVSYYGEDI